MKFTFKIQQYQTDAVEAVVRVFQGQPYVSDTIYMRDQGTLPGAEQQLALSQEMHSSAQLQLLDLMAEVGYKNEALALTEEQLLQNIRNIQWKSNIHQSDALVAPLGGVSLDVEMETGTGRPMSTSRSCSS